MTALEDLEYGLIPLTEPEQEEEELMKISQDIQELNGLFQELYDLLDEQERPLVQMVQQLEDIQLSSTSALGHLPQTSDHKKALLSAIAITSLGASLGGAGILLGFSPATAILLAAGCGFMLSLKNIKIL